MKALEKRDYARIEKLETLTDLETFWDDVRKFTKGAKSDHAINRWQCLAEQRESELKKEKYENMSFDEMMEYVCANNDWVTTEDTLKEYAIEMAQKDYFGIAIHILTAIWENPYDTEYYRYDYSAGTTDTPTPITCYEDIEDLIF